MAILKAKVPLFQMMANVVPLAHNQEVSFVADGGIFRNIDKGNGRGQFECAFSFRPSCQVVVGYQERGTLVLGKLDTVTNRQRMRGMARMNRECNLHC